MSSNQVQQTKERLIALLKQFRKENGIKQSQLAKKIEVSEATISRFERGISTMDVVTYIRAIEALGYTIDFHYNVKVKFNKESIDNETELF